MENVRSYTLDFWEIDKTMLAVAGGKGANLGDLTKIEGIQVPEGFCVTTAAFKSVIREATAINSLLEELATLKVADRNKILTVASAIRDVIEKIAIPHDVRKEIVRSLASLGPENAFAIRSSATAEDLPGASFAGQQDSYLNIFGEDAILQHISKCWASLFTERAIIYRIQNGFDHRNISLAVVVQRMVFPQAAGILFTADPVTSNRKVLSIDAGFGLGEALVSGLVNADVYKVYNGEIIAKKIAVKKLAIYASNNGGTKSQEIEADQQDRQVLTDEQILELEQIGRKLEGHFGNPLDIEWCMADGVFFIVQSRPITTLYPIPKEDDSDNHVYVSVGHQQMMTDPIKPLGLSFFLLATLAHMRSAGGRLFVDVTKQLASPESRKTLMMLAKSDPLFQDAFQTIIEREGFLKPPSDQNERPPLKSYEAVPPATQEQIENDPSIASELIRLNRATVEELKKDIQNKSGADLFDFIMADARESKRVLFDARNMAVILAAMNAAFWINDKMNEWLGEKNAADKISQSVPNNITSEMGLGLLDVADVIRPHREVIDYLQAVKDDQFLDGLVGLKGGMEARKSIQDFLNKYGMRCSGEIDITRSRWSEKPSSLVPLILNNIRNFKPNEGKRKFEQGLQEAVAKEQDLLERLKQLPAGEEKARETKHKIDLVRNLSGYREYPKYGIVNRYFIYKQALLKEAQRLLEAGIIHEKEDVFYLYFEEFQEAVRTNKLDYKIIDQRKQEYKLFDKLTPPRVITSDGEIIVGKYKRENIPANSIVGLAVSSGLVEGRARVIVDMEKAELEEGDILVTAFTDPSWTPLFVSIKGLVTEVGGLMTHGAVIAREYGLPAVVGVENATKLIKDGQRIRVHGTEGYVEILNL